MLRNATALAEVDIGPENQPSGLDMFIGFVIGQKLLKLERNVNPTVSKKVLHGVQLFFIAAVEYITTTFPIADELLTN